MIKLIIWLVWLVVLLFLCFLLSRHILLTPQFGFVGCFIPQAIFAFYFVNKWDLNLSPETMLILVSGTLWFVLSCFVFNLLFSRLKLTEAQTSSVIVRPAYFKKIQVERWKLFAFLFFQILVLLFLVVFYMENIPGGSFAEKISTFDRVSKFGDIEDRIVFPRLLSWARAIALSSCYITMYLFLHSIIMKYKQHNILLLLNILVTVGIMILGGGRFPIIAFIISSVVEAYFIWGKKNQWQKSIKLKTYVKFFGGLLLLLVIFQSSLSLFGRASDISFIDYLGMYISAQLKNLDIFVRRGHFGCDISEWQTLINLVNTLGKYIGIPDWIHTFDQPFLHINGYNLGNVYTVFYWYLHDGGYPAIYIFLTIEAAIMQFFFIKATSLKQKRTIDMNVIIYCYLYYAVVMSFFCERFYLFVASMNFIKYLLGWLLLRFFFVQLRFKSEKRISFVLKSWKI